MARLTRKDFLRLLAAGAGTLAGGELLAACSPTGTGAAAPTSTPTSAPTAPPTAVPTSTPAPSAVPAAVKSRIVHAHHAAAWDGDKLNPKALRQMLDQSIARLTGLDDPVKAWASLFKPTERIAIKVNAFRNSVIWTHPALVEAVTDSLQAAAIPPENITIFDYQKEELETAGFKLNADGPGVRCIGTDGEYGEDIKLSSGAKVQLSKHLLNCDALINMPVLKSHMLTGVTFALKNHYGSILFPDGLHYEMPAQITALNALEPIKNRTRLIVGDVLEANIVYSNGWPYWKSDLKGDSLVMSFDPVAADGYALGLLTALREAAGEENESILGMAQPILEAAGKGGLGTEKRENMDLVELKLA